MHLVHRTQNGMRAIQTMDAVIQVDVMQATAAILIMGQRGMSVMERLSVAAVMKITDMIETITIAEVIQKINLVVIQDSTGEDIKGTEMKVIQVIMTGDPPMEAAITHATT